MISLYYLLVAAALLEFSLLRVLIRLGPMAPADAAMDALFNGLLTLGLAAVNAMVALSLALLGWRWVAAARSGCARQALPASVGLLAGVALAGRGLLLQGAEGTAVSAGVIVVAMSLGVATSGMGWQKQLYLLGPLASYVLLVASYAAPETGPGVWRSSPGLHFFAEALAVAAAAAVPIAFRPPWRRGAAMGAGGVAAGFLGMFAVGSWAPAVLIMWNLGFSLWLPLPLYAIALGLYSYTALALYATGGARVAPVSLVLLALGGLKLDYGPYALLALVGFLGLADPLIGAGAGRPVRTVTNPATDTLRVGSGESPDGRPVRP